MNKIYLFLSLLLLSFYATAQESTPPPKANYQLAAKFSPEKLKKMIFSTTIKPNWINFTDRFWYDFTTPQGKNWYLVDPATNKKEVLLIMKS